MDFVATWLTLALAISTTAILFVVGIPLAYWLATTAWRGRSVLEAVLTLPLVLPPTVLGFYFLILLGPRGPVGSWYSSLVGRSLTFQFEGLLIALVMANLPFAVRPFTAAFESIDRRFAETAWCLGVSRWETFWRITLPHALPGVVAGCALTFAHVLGEFGIVLMIGGNIPGLTRTLSLAVYDDVQAMEYSKAHQTAFFLLVIATGILLFVHGLGKRQERMP